MTPLGDLVGLPLAEARRRLAGAGLSVEVAVIAAPEEAARRRARQVGPRRTLWRVVRAEWVGPAAGGGAPADPSGPGSEGPDGEAGAVGAAGTARPQWGGRDEPAGAAAPGAGTAGPATVRLVVAAFPLPPLPREELEAALGGAAGDSWGPPTMPERGGPEDA